MVQFILYFPFILHGPISAVSNPYLPPINPQRNTSCMLHKPEITAPCRIAAPDRPTDRPTDRSTDRPTDAQTDLPQVTFPTNQSHLSYMTPCLSYMAIHHI